MGQPSLVVENLTKEFRAKRSDRAVVAISQVSFAIGRGEALGLVGESGSGKTTVGRCLLKFIEPTHGRIVLEGIDITAMKERDFRRLRPRIQMVFQEPYYSLNPRMKVFDTIAEPLKLHSSLTKGAITERVHDLMTEVRLSASHLKRYPHQLSSGQQQRVAIARAIAPQPSFLVLDEPTSALDPSIRGEIIDLLATLQREHGMTYLYISHDLHTVQHICDHVAVMYRGRLVEFGTREQVFGNPLHPYTRALRSSVLMPDPAERRQRYRLGLDGADLSYPSAGCPLFSRCPEARAQCSTMPQSLMDFGDGHRVACWRVQEGELWASDSVPLQPNENGLGSGRPSTSRDLSVPGSRFL